ncbi:helix-turn-helix domain-containing protein [Microbacterium sp.]|uniref:helix-turn-helix domain-containing protein n=1 Tax=Microbacterium sp. TaxID=51671 RepID=UPI003C744973
MKEARSSASERFGALVRDLRDKQTISRKQLAELADMDLSHLARIENGQGNPTLFVIIQIATALGVPPERFVEGLTAADLPDDVKPYSLTAAIREMRRRQHRE